MHHLHNLSQSSEVTGMTCRNLALVWAPNLLRSQHETMLGVSEESLRDIGVQARCVEFMIAQYETLFTTARSSDNVASQRISHRRQRVIHGSFSGFHHEDMLMSLQPAPSLYRRESPPSRTQVSNSYSHETKHLPKVSFKHSQILTVQPSRQKEK